MLGVENDLIEAILSLHLQYALIFKIHLSIFQRGY